MLHYSCLLLEHITKVKVLGDLTLTIHLLKNFIMSKNVNWPVCAWDITPHGDAGTFMMFLHIFMMRTQVIDAICSSLCCII